MALKTPTSDDDNLPTVTPKKVTPEVLAERQWFAEQVRTMENPTPEEVAARDKASDELDKLLEKS